MDLNDLINELNIAETLDESTLTKIGLDAVEGYDVDERSREEWLEGMNDSLKLAVQVKEHKNFPWNNSSNIKYPLLTIASLQFQARAYQTLIPDTNVVKGRIIGNDPDGIKADKANRISQHMSYQLLEEIENWEDDMDKACILLPIVGTVFKKIYYDGIQPQIELILPQDLCVNYHAKNLKSAPRISHILPLNENEVLERIRSGDFLDDPSFLEQSINTSKTTEDVLDGQGLYAPSITELSNTPVTFIEQHTWLDLDEDGYKEPYVVIVHKDSMKVARISPRFRPDKVFKNQKGEIYKIEPTEYFEHYIFIPNPVSNIYGIGFGLLLSPINEAVNSLINQLVDSGTLNNLPSGFLGKGIKLMGGNYKFSPGEFKFVQSTGEDLAKGVYQFQFKPPSPVLFNLLGTLISSGQNVASVTDTMQGEMPGQNTPFSTTQEILSQGMKVYSSIMKRMHRSLKKELKKLYQINKTTITQAKYFQILDHVSSDPLAQGQIQGTDYEGDDTDIMPASDPNLVSDVQKLQQSRVIASVMQMGTINPLEASKRILEAERITDIQKLMQKEEPQPTFEQQIKLKELELKEKQQTTNEKLNQFKVAAEAAKDEAEALLNQAKAQQLQMQASLEQNSAKNEQALKQMDMIMKQMEMQLQKMKTEGELLKVESLGIKNELQKQKAVTKKYNKETKTIE